MGNYNNKNKVNIKYATKTFCFFNKEREDRPSYISISNVFRVVQVILAQNIIYKSTGVRDYIK